jgi:hypothetical protein
MILNLAESQNFHNRRSSTCGKGTLLDCCLKGRTALNPAFQAVVWVSVSSAGRRPAVMKIPPIRATGKISGNQFSFKYTLLAFSPL